MVRAVLHDSSAKTDGTNTLQSLSHAQGPGGLRVWSFGFIGFRAGSAPVLAVAEEDEKVRQGGELEAGLGRLHSPDSKSHAFLVYAKYYYPEPYSLMVYLKY